MLHAVYRVNQNGKSDVVSSSEHSDTATDHNHSNNSVATQLTLSQDSVSEVEEEETPYVTMKKTGEYF